MHAIGEINVVNVKDAEQRLLATNFFFVVGEPLLLPSSRLVELYCTCALVRECRRVSVLL